jgi:hypothetical protein
MIRLSRIHLHESVQVSGLTGEKTHLTAETDNVVLTLDGTLLRIVIPGHDTETLVPIGNVRWLWAVAHKPLAPARYVEPALTRDTEEKRDTQQERVVSARPQERNQDDITKKFAAAEQTAGREKAKAVPGKAKAASR